MVTKELLHELFEYRAGATNVAETWRKHGWKAPLRKSP
jgi:hypothetical protein